MMETGSLLRSRHPSRAFTVAAATSALVCATLMVLWVRSVRVNDVLVLPQQRGDHWLITSAFGTFNFQWEAAQVGEIKTGWVFIVNRLPRNWPNDWRWLYFHAYKSGIRHYLFLRSSPVYGVSVPHWFLIGMFGLLPAAWWRRFSDERECRLRIGHGLCRQCGYDLRATPDGGGALQARCPECGVNAIDAVTLSQLAVPEHRSPGSASAEN
jgi:hypothetical protein